MQSREVCWLVLIVCFLASTGTMTSYGQISVSVDATERRSIGGISTLDRTRYFNHHGTLTPGTNTNLGNLENELWLPSGLYSSTGRTGTEFDQFITASLPEDPTRASFLDPAALVAKLQGDYRSFVVSGSRWTSLRQNPNSMYVNAGRSATFWPAFFRTDPSTGITSNYFPFQDAYTEFLTIYLDEVVYGSNSFLPISADRFHIELLNEPDLHLNSSFNASDLANYHRNIANQVKQIHADASVGGPGLALTKFEGNGNYSRWNDVIKPFIDIAGDSMDFFSMHPYERYDVQQNGNYVRAVDQSPGRVHSLIDVVRNYQEIQHGNRLPIAFTEYGSFNWITTDENGNPSNGNYPRDLQQWDLVRDIKEKLMVAIDRPDTILNATPFVSPKDWRNQVPTSLHGDNVFWEQLADGSWQETIVGSMFRCFAQIDGEYVSVDFDSDNIQAVAFRDASTVVLVLSNLTSSSQNLDLSVFAGQNATVQSAEAYRVFRTSGGQNTFLEAESVTSTYQNYSLNPEEFAVVTLLFDQIEEIQSEINESTFYGNQVVAPINIANGQSPLLNIGADLFNALSAKLRISYTRPSESAEAFDAIVNGQAFPVPGGTLPADDGDFGVITREIDVPIAALINGINEIRVEFNGNGGYLSTAALVVTSLQEAIVAPVEFFAIEQGDLVSGTEADLLESDNSDVSARRATSDIQSRVVFEVKGNLPIQQPGNLSLTIEASVFARSAVNLEVQFFNFVTGQFESIQTFSASRFVDSVNTAVATGSAARFAEPNTGCVVARCRFISPSQRQNFVANVDQIFWSVDP